MLFNMKIKAASLNAPFKPNSCLVKFFIESDNLAKELEWFLIDNSFKLNPVQEKYFLDKENSELKFYNTESAPEVVFLFKVKKGEDLSVDYFRNSMAGVVQKIVNEEISYLYFNPPQYANFSGQFENENYYYQTFVEGALLGNYTFTKYKSKKKKEKPLEALLLAEDTRKAATAIAAGQKVVDAVYFARDLVNEPAVVLTPAELAARAKYELKKTGVAVTVFDKKELQKRKMNAILAVGGASVNEPKLIIMHYKPKTKAKKKIALVGKGVTFDAGGLSLKPTSAMMDMNGDMAGAALVIGTIKAVSSLNIPVEIIGVVPAVENVISGSAFKPTDIIISASGKSIEVKDTDAEGRIILADALDYASRQKPDEIIDFATLTGACVVALGEFAAGLFSKNDLLAKNIKHAGNKTYERTWRLPFWDEYKKLLKSDIADVPNLGPRWGGAITAGKFLEHFVDEKITWAHIDIAGPAMKNDLTDYTKKYHTGFGVRLMVEYLSNVSGNKK